MKTLKIFLSKHRIVFILLLCTAILLLSMKAFDYYSRSGVWTAFHNHTSPNFDQLAALNVEYCFNGETRGYIRVEKNKILQLQGIVHKIKNGQRYIFKRTADETEHVLLREQHIAFYPTFYSCGGAQGTCEGYENVYHQIKEFVLQQNEPS